MGWSPDLLTGRVSNTEGMIWIRRKESEKALRQGKKSGRTNSLVLRFEPENVVEDPLGSIIEQRLG